MYLLGRRSNAMVKGEEAGAGVGSSIGVRWHVAAEV